MEDLLEIVAYFPEEWGMDEGGFSMGLGVTIEKRPRQFLPKAKIASERPCGRASRERGLTLVHALLPHPPPKKCT